MWPGWTACCAASHPPRSGLAGGGPGPAGPALLDQLSLAVAEREFVGIIGVSGGGKTTLLRMIAGLLPSTAGSVTLGGGPVLGPSPRTAMVFQHFGLFPWKTVRGAPGPGW
jgi:ABC-type nitrate/sulfonate/bicarbonate transport system ATPase subunit